MHFLLQVRNDKARRFLAAMRHKPGMDLAAYFPKADRAALNLLRRLLAFDPADRPSSEEALADPYFANLHSPAREPNAPPISKLAFDFERRKLTIEEVRELIYREILEYHPQVLQDYLSGGRLPTFLYPSAVDNFKRQFMQAEGGMPGGGQRGNGMGVGRPIVAATSLPRERMGEFQNEAARYLRSGELPPGQQQQPGGAGGNPGQQQQSEEQARQAALQRQQQAQQQQQQAAVAAAAMQQHQAMAQQQMMAQQLMAVQQQQQQQQAMQMYGAAPMDKMSAHVDNLGNHVRSMTVVDHCGPVPVAYPLAYAAAQPIVRSSSYQVQSLQR